MAGAAGNKSTKQNEPALTVAEKVRLLAGLRNYRLFISGVSVSLIGNWVQKVAIGWLAWELTKSATWLGILAFCELMPILLLAPLGGVIADRGIPKQISFNAQLGQTIMAAVLWFLVITGLIEIWMLAILMTIRGTLAAINQPARMSLVPTLLPPEHLPVGLAFNAILYSTARFVGPAVAGIAIYFGGLSAAFALNFFSFLPFLYALHLIDQPPPVRRGVKKGGRDTLRQLADGLGYVRQHKGIYSVLAMFGIMALFAQPVIDLLPGMVARIFSGGAAQLAWMTSAMGLGAMLGAMTVVKNSAPGNLHRLFLGSIALTLANLMIFAWNDALWGGLFLICLLGFSLTVSSVCAQSIIQGTVDNDYRGRVMSLYGVIFRGLPAFGALIIGTSADLFGFGMPFTVAGVLILFAWIGALRNRTAFTAG